MGVGKVELVLDMHSQGYEFHTFSRRGVVSRSIPYVPAHAWRSTDGREVVETLGVRGVLGEVWPDSTRMQNPSRLRAASPDDEAPTLQVKMEHLPKSPSVIAMDKAWEEQMRQNRARSDQIAIQAKEDKRRAVESLRDLLHSLGRDKDYQEIHDRLLG